MKKLDELCIEPGWTSIKVKECQRLWCWHHGRCYNNGSPERAKAERDAGVLAQLDEQPREA